MIVLYTTEEGGEWIPWNTLYSLSEVRGVMGKGLIGESDRLFYPYNDSLPIFHSILLPTAERWDALNGWSVYPHSFYRKEFRVFFDRYVKEYGKPRTVFNFWYDQGPGWKLNDERSQRL